jgi:arginine decarboxylase
MMTYRPLIWSRPRQAEPLLQPEPGVMGIPVAHGIGRGPTELAAFDAALGAAGVADRNLLVLSSVLPPGSAVSRVGRIAETRGGWGDRLYCVLAEARTSDEGAEVWAGIGWMQDDTGRGLLVEHHAASEQGVRGLIAASLGALAENRGLAFPRRGAEVAGARCAGTPVCALVVAAFAAEPWHPAEAA